MMCPSAASTRPCPWPTPDSERCLNLGAGWDTRAYRLRALAHIPIWEVDQHRTIAAKQACLHELFGETPTHVTRAAFDLEEDGLGSALATLGYAAKVRIVFIIEALTQYLTIAAIAQLSN
jgi:methyltransferase (TIGR00027 family)